MQKLVSSAVDYRQRVDEELDEMSASELEKVYRAILFLKEEFFDTGEGRYYTDSWTRAEREATEAYQQGKLKAYASVDEMSSPG